MFLFLWETLPPTSLPLVLFLPSYVIVGVQGISQVQVTSSCGFKRSVINVKGKIKAKPEANKRSKKPVKHSWSEVCFHVSANGTLLVTQTHTHRGKNKWQFVCVSVCDQAHLLFPFLLEGAMFNELIY